MSRLPGNVRAWWVRRRPIYLVKVDVDRGRPLSIRELVKRLARAHRRPVWLAQRRSPSGRGWHVVIRVCPLPRSACETVALQLLCGSDVYREAYNVQRARRVDGREVPRWWRHPDHWNVLYEWSR